MMALVYDCVDHPFAEILPVPPLVDQDQHTEGGHVLAGHREWSNNIHVQYHVEHISIRTRPSYNKPCVHRALSVDCAAQS